MPCDTVRSVTVEFSAATDMAILTAALEASGYTVRQNEHTLFFDKGYRTQQFDKRTHKLIVDQNVDVGQIKRGYSEQVVESQAQKFGWKVSWSTNAAGNREAAVQRRAF
jgi:hypothetical protein